MADEAAEGTGIPEEVRRFILDAVPSVTHIEVLLQLHARPAEWWSAGRMAAEVRMPAAAVLDRMEELCRRGLLEVRIGEDLVFRYAPARPELDRAAMALAHVYPAWRVAIAELIVSKRGDPVRDFSEAFRIRREDTDG
jgi:hypothetical protein